MPWSLIAQVRTRVSCAQSRNRQVAQSGSGSLPALASWKASTVCRGAEMIERIAGRWDSSQHLHKAWR